jgi:predicted HTH transcriptional regulator
LLEKKTSKSMGSQQHLPRDIPQQSTSRIPGPPEHTGPVATLSPRQSKALPAILQQKMITRKEYQQIVDAGLPARTANYDLNDMMQKGILRREGAGSTTRYKLDPNADVGALKKLLNT